MTIKKISSQKLIILHYDYINNLKGLITGVSIEKSEDFGALVLTLYYDDGGVDIYHLTKNDCRLVATDTFSLSVTKTMVNHVWNDFKLKMNLETAKSNKPNFSL